MISYFTALREALKTIIFFVISSFTMFYIAHSSFLESNRFKSFSSWQYSAERRFRRGEEVVVTALRRRSRNTEISHFLASRRAGELGQSSLLLAPLENLHRKCFRMYIFYKHLKNYFLTGLVANDALGHQFASSRLEYYPNSLRSIDFVFESYTLIWQKLLMATK